MVMGNDLSLTLRLLESNSTIEKKIRKAMAAELNKKFNSIGSGFRVQLG